MPTPVKYQNSSIETAFKGVERAANESLLSMLPADLAGEYAPLLNEEDETLKPLVKAADKLSALVKCIEERKAGNTEFKVAEKSTLKRIKKMNVPEAEVFLNEFLPAYEQTLDTL